MICPRCKSEFHDGVESCPKCAGKQGSPHTFDIHLFPFNSAKAANDVGRYLLSISKDKNPERIKSLFANLPQIVFKGMVENKAILMSQKLNNLGADARVIRTGKVKQKKIDPQAQNDIGVNVDAPRLSVPIVKADEPAPPIATKMVVSVLLVVVAISLGGWALYGFFSGRFDGLVDEIRKIGEVVTVENKKNADGDMNSSVEKPDQQKDGAQDIQLMRDEKYREELEKLIEVSIFSDKKGEVEKTEAGSLEENYIRLGWEKYKKKEYDLALEAFNSTLEDKPTAKGYAGRGFVYSARGNKISAMKAFKKSLDLDNDSELVHFIFAAMLYDDNSLEDAQEHFEKVVRLNPQNDTAKKYLSEIEGKLVE